MITKGLNKSSTKFSQTQIERFCLECGGLMTEVDHCNENGALYVWYQCSGNNCNGQWLQKMPVSILK